MCEVFSEVLSRRDENVRLLRADSALVYRRGVRRFLAWGHATREASDLAGSIVDGTCGSSELGRCSDRMKKMSTGVSWQNGETKSPNGLVRNTPLPNLLVRVIVGDTEDDHGHELQFFLMVGKLCACIGIPHLHVGPPNLREHLSTASERHDQVRVQAVVNPESRSRRSMQDT